MLFPGELGIQTAIILNSVKKIFPYIFVVLINMGSIFALQQNLSLSFLSPLMRRLLGLLIIPKKMRR